MQALDKLNFSSKIDSGDPVKGMGLFIVICGICPTIISVVFMSLYASLLDVALTMQSTIEEQNPPLADEYSFFYDYGCTNNIDKFRVDKSVLDSMFEQGLHKATGDTIPADLESSGWSTIYLFNVALYAIL